MGEVLARKVWKEEEYDGGKGFLGMLCRVICMYNIIKQGDSRGLDD